MAAGLVTLNAAVAAPPAGQEENGPFEVASEAVLVDFVVRDRHGRPVRDLTPGEVQVLEDGRIQEILTFRLITAAARRHEAEDGVPPSLPRSPRGAQSPDFAASTGMEDLTFPSLVAVVLDNLSMASRHFVLPQLKEFVRNEGEAGHLIGLFVVDQRLEILQEFTTDAAAVLSALDRALSVQDTSYPDLTKQVLDRMEDYQRLVRDTRGPGDVLGAEAPRIESTTVKVAEMLLNMARLQRTAQREQAGRASVYSLLDLVRAMGSVEGRKAVLYVSEGIEVPMHVEPVFAGLIGTANRLNVAVYAVDARGLTVARPREEAERAQRLAAETGRLQQTTQLTPFSGFFTVEEAKLEDVGREVIRMNPEEVLQDLAVSTGGFLISSTNDLRPGLERVAEDLAFHYELAYIPDRREYDGSFRRIEVRVSRPGVAVQARAGYFALPPGTEGEVLPYEFPLLEALNNAEGPGEIPIELEAFRFDCRSPYRQVCVVMEMPLSSLHFAHREGRYASRLGMLILVYDGGGQVVRKVSRFYPVQVPVVNLNTLRQGRAILVRCLRLPPGSYTLKAVAADLERRVFGFQQRVVDVEPPKAQLCISSLVPVREARRRGDGNYPEDPLNYGPYRILPRPPTLVLQPEDSIPLYLTLYPDPDRTEPPQLRLEIRRGGRLWQGVDVQVPATPQEGPLPLLVALPMAWFEPGSYEIRAVSRQGNHEAVTSLPLLLDDGGR
ncbi:MAG: hypothetical protein Kow00109_29450 [Acidobacteriota bacterium]